MHSCTLHGVVDVDCKCTLWPNLSPGKYMWSVCYSVSLSRPSREKAPYDTLRFTPKRIGISSPKEKKENQNTVKLKLKDQIAAVWGIHPTWHRKDLGSFYRCKVVNIVVLFFWLKQKMMSMLWLIWQACECDVHLSMVNTVGIFYSWYIVVKVLQLIWCSLL